jgi:HlyD family secretion protein
VRELVVAISVVLLASCSHTGPPPVQAAALGSNPGSNPGSNAPRAKREVRLTGIIEAVHSSKVLVPQIFGPGGALTLTKLIPNGSEVKEGDVVALFDNTQQADTLRDTQAKYDDLGHQVEQKQAQNRADFEKRTSDLKQAEADLAKAEMELQKGPILAEIDRLKDEEKVVIARKHVESL